MADIFVSYARADKQRVAPLVAALEAQGFSVWWDPEIAPGQEFDALIRRELNAAKAVVVVWTPVSVESRWVKGEARLGAERGVLVPVRFDKAQLPIDALSVHTTDLDGWSGNPGASVFQELTRALAALLGQTNISSIKADTAPRGTAICVLPFANMSDDREQEYFSDGISEDIITDLSKVSALSIVARNTAFAYKGKAISIPQVAQETKSAYVLEGSVRKSGNRLRITAQLIDGVSGNHIWAERYDRDLSDIFKLQDEISEAIVTALRVKLLPEERQAIERRGTTNLEAYNQYLLARKYFVSGSERHTDIIVRLCQRAIELDPAYAHAWALLAYAKFSLFRLDKSHEDGSAEAQRAIALDPRLAEGHAARAIILRTVGSVSEALAAAQTALALDPDSYEANRTAGSIFLQQRRYADAIRHFDKAASIMPDDYIAAALAIQCYQGMGDDEGAFRACRRALARIEKLIAVEPEHGSAMGHGAGILAILGEKDKAREWIQRSLLLDPGNQNLQGNIVCTLVLLGDHEAALDQLDRVLHNASLPTLRWIETDNDLDPIRHKPRFKAAFAAAEKRLVDQKP